MNYSFRDALQWPYMVLGAVSKWVSV